MIIFLSEKLICYEKMISNNQQNYCETKKKLGVRQPITGWITEHQAAKECASTDFAK